MKKTIPFNKEISFNTNIYEINSISLEHNFKTGINNVSGEFIITGDYKKNEFDINNEPFIYNLPFNIDLDSKYNIDNIKVEIEDFNYKINNSILNVDINLSIDGLEEEEAEIIEEIEEVEEPVREYESIIDNIKSLDELYVTYNVHIFREEDTIDNIIKLYNTSKEELEEYNDLSKITIGSKLIIPSND